MQSGNGRHTDGVKLDVRLDGHESSWVGEPGKGLGVWILQPTMKGELGNETSGLGCQRGSKSSVCGRLWPASSQDNTEPWSADGEDELTCWAVCHCFAIALVHK